MCRVFRLVLVGALLAFPLSAAQKTEPSLSAFLQTLSPVATAQAMTDICPLSFPNCCTPDYSDCSRDYSGVNFVRQKDNGVCVYQCPYTQTCNDTACNQPPIISYGSFRVRSAVGQYPMGGCPAADPNFCVTMEVGE